MKDAKSHSGIPWGWPQWIALAGALALLGIVVTTSITFASAGPILLPLALLASFRAGKHK